MNGLNFENIMSGDEIENLFMDTDTEQETTVVIQDDDTTVEDIEIKDTTEVNPETLFTDEPESVGSGLEDSQEEQEDTQPDKAGSSPKTNFYSSIAKALHEEGIFPDLDEETTKGIKTPEDFAHAIESQVQAKFDARQQRIDTALNAGIETSEIKRFEQTLGYLDSIKDDLITEEETRGEDLRKNLIFQDYVNRGYSKERATREVQKSLNAGSDIEDAREALKSNREYFESQYNDLIEDAKLEEKKLKDATDAQAETFRKSLLEDKKAFGEITLDNKTRQKIFDNVTKPIHKDPETGQYYTAIQKYEKENRTDFLKNVSLIYTLTDGFKNLDGLVKGKVNKEVKKGLRELENTINNTSRTLDGNLRFASGVSDDPDSFIGKGFSLDI